MILAEWPNDSIAETYLNIHQCEIIERFGLKTSGDFFVCFGLMTENENSLLM